jgi:osmotically-inducible protein OsmY
MKVKNTISAMLAAAATLMVFSAPLHAASMDSRIESSAKQSYVFKTYLQGDDIKIQSRDGAVTLTGMVPEESHKTLAQDTVSGLPGVKSVVNKLEVKGSTPAANSDAWLTTKVKTTLLFHRSVSAGTTEVDVKDGIATLKGTADNQAQKELTTEYVKDIEGIKDVNNELTVKNVPKKKRTAGDKIDDASITAQVKAALLYHRSTSAVNTKVETRQGLVTLNGKANSIAEFNLATKIAKDVKGVKDVKNRMSVE